MLANATFKYTLRLIKATTLLGTTQWPRNHRPEILLFFLEGSQDIKFQKVVFSCYS